MEPAKNPARMSEESRLREAAESAAEWVLTLPEATEQQILDFEHWLLASPLHVREYLLAAHIDEELRKLDPKRPLPVDLTVGPAAGNVIHFIHRDIAEIVERVFAKPQAQVISFPAQGPSPPSQPPAR